MTADWPVKPSKRAGLYVYPAGFEEIWSAYPSRGDAGNPKLGAYKAVRARVRSGDDPTDLLKAARGYALHCRGSQKDGTEFVLQAQTFFGPREPWREYLQLTSSNGSTAPKISDRMARAIEEAKQREEEIAKAERDLAELRAWWRTLPGTTRQAIEAAAEERYPRHVSELVKRMILRGVASEWRERELLQRDP